MKIGTLVEKNTNNWKSNEFDAWGRGVGIGTVVLSPFSLDDEAVDVVWPEGRCFENLDQIVEVRDLQRLSETAALHWRILYKDYIEYLEWLINEGSFDNSWQWFINRHYAKEIVEWSRNEIVKASIIDTENSESKIGTSTLSTIERVLLKLNKAQ